MTRHNHTILTEDVLLEIFDAYRQLHELQPDYEQAWNDKDGWLKLAHVCLHWRRVVFLSSSRLHVHLLLTPRRPWSPILRYLPNFPIYFDYTTVNASPLRWTEKEENLALAAISHRSRVRRISLEQPCPPRVLQALSHSFPELESLTLDLCSIYAYVPPKQVSPTVFLSGSTPCLRQLTLRVVVSEALSALLSSTMRLEELVLTLRVVRGSLPEASLIANLQCLSCLRRLELELVYPHRFSHIPPPSTSTGDVVTLPRLTDFIFKGHGSYLQILVARLAAPSLQHLHIEHFGDSATFPIPQLSSFICDTGCQFKVVHLDFLYWRAKFCAETLSKSDHARPLRITLFGDHCPLEQIGQMFSGPLSTVEELIVGREMPPSQTQYQQDRIQWREFFNRIRQVKIVRVHYQLALFVAHSLQRDDQEPDLDLFPALEQVNVYLPIRSNGKARYVSIRDTFEPFMAARQQVGRPIRLLIDGLSWA